MHVHSNICILVQPAGDFMQHNEDYALTGYKGQFNRKLPIIKKPLSLRFVDDESGVKRDIHAYDVPEETDETAFIYPSSLGPEQDDEFINDAKSSTERVRKYYRKNKAKVRKYLRDTVKDRSARNRDRRKAIKKHGKSKMKNHDVHHPKGPNGGSWRLAKKDHGRDKVNELFVQLVEGVDIDHINKFVDYTSNRLKFNTTPTVAVIEPSSDSTSLGHYSPDTNVISVVVKGRLLADILRTVAHELAHHKQFEMGLINSPQHDGKTGSPVENKANVVAGILLRDYGKHNKYIFLSESLLLEGGAAGHLAHPFEDEDLTFGDMKEMIKRGLIGGLDQEAPVTEKLDGQNIAFSVRNGQIVFARNKGQVKARGKNALDVAGIRQMFAGRGNIEKAFTGAAEDLQSAVAKLSPEQVQQMFGEGSKFMSLEVILPDTQNVIPYGKSVLVMHGTIEYDENGEEIGRSTTDGKQFADALTSVGAEQQRTFGISGPRTIAFSEAESDQYQERTQKYSDTLDRASTSFGLDDSSTLAEYRQAWWAGEIQKEMERTGVDITEDEFDGLIRRWADGDKKFGVKDIINPETKKWFRQYEKESLQNAQKKMIRPIETVFLQAGADSLRRVTNFLSANNPAATQQLKKDVLDAITAIRDSNQPDKIAKLQKELERLESIGMDKVVPSEGVVFIYNGKPYKFTGTFAPINQITGTFKFGMAPKEELEEPETPNVPETPKAPETPTEPVTPKAPETPKRTVAIFTGRFQPFHAGHYSIYQTLVDRFGKENVYIASSNATDPVKSPFEFREKKEIMTRMFDIPEDNVVQVKNPYAPKEILDKLPDTTTYVTAVSQKDAERLGGKYFRDYDSVPDGKHQGFKDQGYFIVAPEMQLNIDGKNISGTALRAAFGDPRITDRAKQEIFTKVYGRFDPKIFKKIVKVTTDAEEARKVTDQHGSEKTKAQGKSSGSKKPDQQTLARARSVLRQKVRNPKTERDILVATALTYAKEEPVRQAAEKMIQNAMKQRTEQILVEEKTTGEDLKVYTYTRDYTPDELQEEMDEYFKNEKTLKIFPNLARTERDLMEKITDAESTVLTREQLLALQNSDVAALLTQKNKTDLLKKMAHTNKKDIVSIAQAVKNKDDLPLPIVIKYKTGQYLMAGNSRLSVLAAMNTTMPVKELEYTGEVSYDLLNIDNDSEKKTTQDGKKRKTLFKDILQMRITNPETGNQIKIDTAMDYKKTHPAHRIARDFIRQKMSGFSSRAGVPKNSGPK